MEIPKLRWLKTHLPRDVGRRREVLRPGGLSDLPKHRAGRALALHALSANGRTWARKAAGTRSFSQAIGLGDLLDGGRVGTDIRPMGEPIGPTDCRSRRAFGADRRSTVVGVGIIDAHAGGLGVLGAETGDWNSALWR